MFNQTGNISIWQWTNIANCSNCKTILEIVKYDEKVLWTRNKWAQTGNTTAIQSNG